MERRKQDLFQEKSILHDHNREWLISMMITKANVALYFGFL